MYSPFQLAQKYLRYFFTASNGKGHGVHSPFVFDFITKVLNDKKHYPAYVTVEGKRKELLRDHRILSIEDHGAGSTTTGSKSRKVSQIAATSLKPAKYGQLLFRIAKYYQARQVLELGTCLGITTTYFSQAAAKVHSVEGSPETAAMAAQLFSDLGLRNVLLYPGTFEEQLPAVLKQINQLDLAFIDGNHRREPTLQYFSRIKDNIHENSILIFDDIHWSAGMEAAWEEIKNDEAVTLSIDLFFIGLVFFRKDFKVKQHFTIRF